MSHVRGDQGGGPFIMKNEKLKMNNESGHLRI